MIGIDVDTKNGFAILKTYFNAKAFGRVEVSETIRGVHIRIRSKTKSAWKQMQIRRAAGDCSGRLMYDDLLVAAGVPECVDTLFKYKSKRGGQRMFAEEPMNPLSEPFWQARYSSQKHRRWGKWFRGQK